MKYVALLRGINVGGNNLIRMAELKESLGHDGITDVRTYIQSGNILFTSKEADTLRLAAWIEKHILDEYGHTVPTVVFSEADMRRVVEKAPKGWGENDEWRYNTIFLLPPAQPEATLKAMGEPAAEIETYHAGHGVVYQSAEIKSITRSRLPRVIGKPVYQVMTIRNWNTTRKILELMQQ